MIEASVPQAQENGPINIAKYVRLIINVIVWLGNSNGGVLSEIHL